MKRKKDVTIGGVRKSLAAWGELLGVSRERARQLHRSGQLASRVSGLGGKRALRTLRTINPKKYGTASEVAEAVGINPTTLDMAMLLDDERLEVVETCGGTLLVSLASAKRFRDNPRNGDERENDEETKS